MSVRHVLLALSACVLLTACGGDKWVPPVYSGKQESTEGVPGFDRGQKRSPYVKLGQSYKVLGEWYVPRHQPDYDETGLASWYGPGFHGGKTANGERFDKHSMTAAHKTLPLPSLVRVTMVETGQSAIVRINDRGPFSKGRIIDLSYAAAKEIGLMRKGVAKVRVEYLLPESQRFADLLAQGRDPEDIDIAQDVLPYAGNTQIAAAEIKEMADRPATDPRWFPQAHAAEPLYSGSEPNAAPVDSMSSSDLMPPAELPPPTVIASTSVFTPVAAEPAPQPVPAVMPEALFVQLGTFSMEGNAHAMARKASDVGAASVTPVQRGDATLFRVRLGPYENVEMAEDVLQRVQQLGMVDARFVKP